MFKGKYILFGFDHYYPAGGLFDAKTSFASDDELKEWLQRNYVSDDVYQILELETGKHCDYEFKWDDEKSDDEKRAELHNWFMNNFC